MIDVELVKILVHAVSTDIFHFLVIPVVVFSAFFYFFGIVGILQKNGKKSRETRKFPKVTVQIPTFNEPIAIRCAEHCIRMDYPRNKFDVIIGDDSSDKKVSAMIDDFAQKHRIKVTRRGTNEGFKAGNINNMLRYSKGEIIVIFDSDFVPPPDFLKRIVKPFEDKRVACVQSKWSYLNMEQSPTSKFASTVLMVYHNILARLNNMAGVPLLFGSGEAVRKNVIEKLGGWQEGVVRLSMATRPSIFTISQCRAKCLTMCARCGHNSAGGLMATQKPSLSIKDP
ncbi:MAG: glycosyltransferase [Candidatus Aenigmarchaeota archaeon]|nr:glycosyltransferase [Candidatus Aenigmarchaeota archaeon]